MFGDFFLKRKKSCLDFNKFKSNKARFIINVKEC